MKDFEFFLRRGDVKRRSPDKNLAKATFRESLDRIELSKTVLIRAKSKYILENAYESMREAADAVLYVEGFKSFSHEASIVYLLKKGFSESDIFEFDRFRKLRNGIKYYGGDCEKDDAESAIKLAERVIKKIKEILDSSL